MEFLAPASVLAIALLLVLAAWVPIWMTKRNRGQALPDVSEIPSGVAGSQERFLLYLFRPGCSRCHRVTPRVDALVRQGVPVVKLNVTEWPEVAARFRGGVTPSIMLVERGMITEVLVGPGAGERVADLLK